MKQFVWVRPPLPVPSRSKLCIACSDFLQKAECPHAAAPPFPISPALLRFDRVFFDEICKLRIAASCQNRVCVLPLALFFYAFGRKTAFARRCPFPLPASFPGRTCPLIRAYSHAPWRIHFYATFLHVAFKNSVSSRYIETVKVTKKSQLICRYPPYSRKGLLKNLAVSIKYAQKFCAL